MHSFLNKFSGPSLGAVFPIMEAARFMASTGEFEHGIAMQLAAVAFCTPGHDPAEIFEQILELIHNNTIEVYLQLKYDGENSYQRLLVRDMTSAATFEWPIKLVAHAPADIDALAGEIYSEYCYSVGWRAFNGDPLPVWADFSTDENKTKQADGWRRAAMWAVHRSGDLLLRESEIRPNSVATREDREYFLREKRQQEMIEEMAAATLGMFKPGGLIDQLVQEQRANQARQTAALEGIHLILAGKADKG